ncbi:hypothetical protein PM082_001106 [Marasmius tenuissimus]|nr:hypothetical protein PM082_001106 [Marasmius tenuissimus]
MSFHSSHPHTASAHAASAGRSRQDSLTLEDCISQIYSGLDQVDSDTTNFADFLNSTQPSSSFTQPTSSSGDQAIFDLNNLQDLSFFDPSFSFDFSLPPSRSSFEPLNPSAASVVPQAPLLTLAAETTQSWVAPNSDFWNFNQPPASFQQAELDVQLFGHQFPASMDLCFDAGVNPMSVVSNDLANHFVEASSGSGNYYSSIDDYVLPPPPVFSDSDFESSREPSPQPRELRPLPRRALTGRVNSRWSPGSDETTSDGEFQPQPRRSQRKRTAVGSPRQSPTTSKRQRGQQESSEVDERYQRAMARLEERSQIKEEAQERNSSDEDVSRTVFDLKDGKLVLRCPSMSDCSRRFETVDDAVTHLIHEHPAMDKTGRYRCTFRCNHVLFNTGDIDRHKESLVHTPKKAFTCLACLHSYTRKDPLKRHHDNQPSHKPLHNARLEAGVEAVCDHTGTWKLKAPSGYKDTACKNAAFAIDTLTYWEKRF